MPLPTTIVDGMFYIDNLTGDFWLRESSVWNYKGNLRSGSSNIITDEGPPPDGGVVGQQIMVGEGVPS